MQALGGRLVAKLDTTGNADALAVW